MKVLLSVLFFSAFLSIAQTLEDADQCFNRYEYAKAISGYEKLQNTKKLSIKQFKNLAFSYFTVGDFNQTYRLTDSLVKMNNIESFFVYAHGYAAFAIGNYSVAKKYLMAYRTKEKNTDLDQLIKATEVINSWSREPVEYLALFPNNSVRAEASQDIWKGKLISLKEKGITKTAASDKLTDLSSSEFLYKVPYIVNSSDTSWSEITIVNQPIPYMTFNAISISEQGTVLCNLSGYDQQGKYIEPKNYIGTLSEKLTLENLSLFLPVDSLLFTGAAINESGNRAVLSAKSKSQKDSDLYSTELTDGKWSKPTLAIPWNTRGNEAFPVFSGDSLLYFSSDGRMGYGGLDLFAAQVSTSAEGIVSHLPYPLNSASDDFGMCKITSDSLVFTSNRFNGRGDDDVWKYVYPKTPEIVSIKDSMDTVQKTPYVSVKNIVFYFDFDSYTVKEIPDSLTEFIAFLTANEAYKLILVGRTDHIGTIEYNSYLGEMRAKAVAKLLVSRGVDPKKLQVISKGKTDPVVRCAPCNAASNAKNRIVNLDIVIP